MSALGSINTQISSETLSVGRTNIDVAKVINNTIPIEATPKIENPKDNTKVTNLKTGMATTKIDLTSATEKKVDRKPPVILGAMPFAITGSIFGALSSTVTRAPLKDSMVLGASVGGFVGIAIMSSLHSKEKATEK